MHNCNYVFMYVAMYVCMYDIFIACMYDASFQRERHVIFFLKKNPNITNRFYKNDILKGNQI